MPWGPPPPLAEVPPGFAAVLRRALAPHPEARYPTAAVLAAALPA